MRRFALILLPLMLLTACGASPSDTEDDTSSETELEAGVTDLALMGKNVTCTMTHTEDDGTLTGTVYVSGDGKVAGDFSMTGTPLGTMTFHMIRAGEYAYTWGVPSATTGIKVKIDAEEQTAPGGSDTSVPDIDSKMSYRCKRWTVDASKFVPPTSVTFQEPQEMMKAMMKGDCAVCDNVPDPEGQASCREAMGC